MPAKREKWRPLFFSGGGGEGGRVGYGYTWADGLVQFFSKDPSDDTSV